MAESVLVWLTWRTLVNAENSFCAKLSSGTDWVMEALEASNDFEISVASAVVAESTPTLTSNWLVVTVASALKPKLKIVDPKEVYCRLWLPWVTFRIELVLLMAAVSLASLVIVLLRKSVSATNWPTVGRTVGLSRLL